MLDTRNNGMREVYRCIHQHGPITKLELIQLTGMKQTTVVRRLDDLMNSGWIRIKQHDISSGGRPPALYEIEPTAAVMIGIDLSRRETTVSMNDMSFNIIGSHTFQMKEDHTPVHTISLIKEKITDLFQTYKVDEENLLGIGIGTVGPLDRNQGTMHAKNFIAGEWDHFPIVHELNKTFNTTILLENGANTAALYETMTRPDSKNQSILYCISGWGMRCGYVLNGEIMHDKQGDASSFGEMIINPYTKGTLASYISYEYILSKIEQKRTLTNVNKNEKKNQLMHALLSEDPEIQDIVLDSAYYYGIGLANMINILHPKIVILNSEMIRKYPTYYEKIIETAQDFVFQPEKQNPEFRSADFKVNPASVGASMLVFNAYFKA
ncbi:ROK family transcriptional regulator [Salicibibacter kimchii]|uniref:ROK family transcriptional regulator n=1 Tax=Salicibibacter kimchii TaxID=2099786 RepID=A0A345C1G8_9BACI|nr:ROK family transcriptional regulator [Salicibibacter kimchii]AXF57049.1 ROK family transcriptional regulator [Salicibibacter kimchii]